MRVREVTSAEGRMGRTRRGDEKEQKKSLPLRNHVKQTQVQMEQAETLKELQNLLKAQLHDMEETNKLNEHTSRKTILIAYFSSLMAFLSFIIAVISLFKSLS